MTGRVTAPCLDFQQDMLWWLGHVGGWRCLQIRCGLRRSDRNAEVASMAIMAAAFVVVQSTEIPIVCVCVLSKNQLSDHFPPILSGYPDSYSPAGHMSPTKTLFWESSLYTFRILDKDGCVK